MTPHSKPKTIYNNSKQSKTQIKLNNNFTSQSLQKLLQQINKTILKTTKTRIPPYQLSHLNIFTKINTQPHYHQIKTNIIQIQHTYKRH